MTKLIRVLGIKDLNFQLKFLDGYSNLILFSDERLRCNIIKCVYNSCKKNKQTPYIISGFNLKPYLNLRENIYYSFGIDLDFNIKERKRFSYYCKLLNFKWSNINFHFLSLINKLKSIFIASFFSGSKIIVFDEVYWLNCGCYVNSILRLIKKFNLFSDRVFVRIKKQVLI